MLELLLSYFLVYQYYLLFAVMLTASIGFPIPASALLLAGGAFYAQGYFDISLLLLSGYLGCIIGDITSYTLSYVYGKGVFRRIGLGRIIDSEYFQSFEPFFIRHSVISVFFSRFLVTGLGPTVNILAGLTRMKPSHFITTDLVGEALYIIIYTSIGYSFGAEWEAILEILESFGSMLMILGILAVLIYFIWKYARVAEEPQIEEGRG